MTKIKICGITNLQDALLAVQAGADALGFIFAPSPRQVTSAEVRNMVRALPPQVVKVGVFGEAKLKSVQEIMQYCCLDKAQLHGNFTKKDLLKLAGKAFKVFDMTSEHVLEEIEIFSPAFFMLDLPKGEGKPGRIPWKVVNAAKEWGDFILAGGLSPENIEKALERANPFGVDVCRGVERKPGEKCPGKVLEFIVKVKKWNGILKKI